jgi:hypothetical protein
MATRRLRLGSAVWLFALACMAVFSGAQAGAAITHEYISQITEVPVVAGAPLPGSLSELDSMTVDSGHLWVAEHVAGIQSGRVDEFDASTGAFVSQFPQVSNLEEMAGGIAVGHATGSARVYVGALDEAQEGRVGVFSETGALLETWTGAQTPKEKAFGADGISSVAVDNSSNIADWAAGDVYVADTVEDVVDVFKPEVGGGEHLVAQITGVEGAPFAFSEGSAKIAVNQANGDVLVVEAHSGEAQEIDVFEPTVLDEYEFVRKITGPTGSNFGHVTSLAVDAASSDLYAAEENTIEGRIYEFDSGGTYLGQVTATGTPAANFRTLNSLVVDPETSHLFVGDYRYPEGSVVDVFGPDVVVPDVTTGLPSNVEPESATLTGTVNPDKAGVATCRFEYGTSTAFDKVAPCSAPVAEGESPVAVHTEIAGLQPDTTYHYLLGASNAKGTNPGKSSDDQEFTTSGPGIRDESTSNVASSSATLDASIDPHGRPTYYYFQYGTSTVYGTDVPTPPGAALGFGENEVEISQHLQGLSADTTYHYRVVALSELMPGEPEAFYGVDQTFTTQTVSGSAMLPDGRAWEMVSPVDKHGAQIYAIGQYSGEGAVIQASAAGNAITYLTDSPTEAEPQGYTNLQQVLSTRGSGGWASRNIAIPNSDGTGIVVGFGEEYRFFSEDLLSSVVQPFGAFMPSLSAEASEQTAYLRTDFVNGNTDSPCVSSCYLPLVTGAPGYANVPPGTIFGKTEGGGGLFAYANGPKFLGATSDLSHIVLSSNTALTSTSIGGVQGLYEWSAGKLALVSVLPGGEAATAGPVLGNNENARHAISDDGSRITWAEQGRHLYLRDMTRGESGETVQLDAVQGGSGEGNVEPVFQTASSDGSKVFFTDGQKLTKDSGAQGREEPDLYQCEIVVVANQLTCDLSDLTPTGADGPAGVQGGVIGASEDGSWIYFVANGVLAPGAVQGTCGGLPSTASSRSCNLYVRHDGVTSLVAVLSGADGPDWSGTLSSLTARVSPDGRWLAFMSERELTGYDNRDAVSGKPDEEVYLYDAESGSVSCASCDPTGARPVGSEYPSKDTLWGGDRVWGKSWLASNIPGWTPYQLDAARYQSRYLSDSGRLFFNSDDALVPQDVNGSWDAYEYEPQGVGDCTSSNVTFSERSDGCVGLISSGSSKGESAFLDASATGGDVFFLTSGKLLSEDRDTILDIYDAHECTSGSRCFAVAPVLPPPCDTGDSCKASPTPQPTIFGSPSSATFSGAGNVVLQGSKSAVQAKGLTRAQKLARALKACQKKKGKRRTTCVRQAKAKYGAKNASKANATKKGRG